MNEIAIRRFGAIEFLCAKPPQVLLLRQASGDSKEVSKRDIVVVVNGYLPGFPIHSNDCYPNRDNYKRVSNFHTLKVVKLEFHPVWPILKLNLSVLYKRNQFRLLRILDLVVGGVNRSSNKYPTKTQSNHKP